MLPRMSLEREAISNDMIANQNNSPRSKLSFNFYDMHRPFCRTLRIHLLTHRSNCARRRLDNVVEERGTSVTPLAWRYAGHLITGPKVIKFFVID